MYYNFNRTYLKDALVSLASKLPSNVVVDVNSSEGLQAILFVVTLSDRQLSEFKTEAERQKGSIQISFSAQASENDIIKDIDICKYPWREAKKVKFNGNTCKSVDTYHDVDVGYINVIFCEY